LRLWETGNIEVKVLFILASQLFLLLSAISNDVTNIKHPQFFVGRHQNQVFLPHYDYAGQIDALQKYTQIL